MLEHFIPPAPPPPPPLIPSFQTAFDSTSGPQSLAPGTVVSLSRAYSPSPPPAPASAYTASPSHAVMGGPPVAPPPPPPGPPHPRPVPVPRNTPVWRLYTSQEGPGASHPHERRAERPAVRHPQRSVCRENHSVFSVMCWMKHAVFHVLLLIN